MTQTGKGGGGGGGGGGGVGSPKPKAALRRAKTQHLEEMQARQVHQSLAAQEHNEMQQEMREHGELLCAVGMGDAFGEESAIATADGGRPVKRVHSAVAVTHQLVLLSIPAQALRLALAAHAEHHAPTEPVRLHTTTHRHTIPRAPSSLDLPRVPRRPPHRPSPTTRNAEEC